MKKTDPRCKCDNPQPNRFKKSITLWIDIEYSVCANCGGLVEVE